MDLANAPARRSLAAIVTSMGRQERSTGSRGPAWRLDEIASAGRENLDGAHVALYDEKEDSRAAAELELLAELGLNAGSVVVDVGAGTGQFTVAAAATGADVVAVDVSPVMLARLEQKVAAASLGNVRTVRAGFLSYDHEGPPADFLYTRWALHHLPDFWKALALERMHRVLRPGGVLRLADIVYSFDVADAEARLEQWCATLPETAASSGEWVRGDIEEHVRDEHSTFTWLLEPMIERAGFRIERSTYSPDAIFAEYVARAI